MITPRADRRHRLIAKGVPEPFLDAIDDSGNDGQLRFMLRYPEGAYFYLPDVIDTYRILKGWEITPIYEGCNEDTFWVMLSNPVQTKFVHFELEQDEVYTDYGADPQLLVADFVVRYYESAHTQGVDQIAQFARKIGLSKGGELLEALEDADRNGLRSTFEGDECWRQENLPRFI